MDMKSLNKNLLVYVGSTIKKDMVYLPESGSGTHHVLPNTSHNSIRTRALLKNGNSSCINLLEACSQTAGFKECDG